MDDNSDIIEKNKIDRFRSNSININWKYKK
jgi:hypothetical protein